MSGEDSSATADQDDCSLADCVDGGDGRSLTIGLVSAYSNPVELA